MKTIVFVSEKGGVGKTRLADELYYFYQRTGVPVSLYSFDGQYKNRTADKKSDNPDVAVVDTPGRLMDDKTVQTLQGADLVVIPTRPTAGNVEAFTRTIALVEANVSCPVFLVVNGGNRFVATRSFMEWLDRYMKKSGLDLVMTIPQSEVMVQAEAYSCSVVEINRHSPAAFAVSRFCERASRLAGILVTEQQATSKKLLAK